MNFDAMLDFFEVDFLFGAVSFDYVYFGVIHIRVNINIFLYRTYIFINFFIKFRR